MMAITKTLKWDSNIEIEFYESFPKTFNIDSVCDYINKENEY